MRFYVLSGDDQQVNARRKELLVGRKDLEHLDCGEDGGHRLVDAISSPSLFGGERTVIVENLNDASEQILKQIQASSEHSNALVVACLEKLDAKTQKRLKPFCEIEKLKTPKGREISAHLRELGAEYEVKLNQASLQLLEEKAGEDLPRAESVIKALWAGGFHTANPGQVDALLGSSGREEKPWNLETALEQKNLVQALIVASNLDAIAGVNYLASRLLKLSLLVENNTATKQEASSLLGGSEWAAGKMLAVSKKTSKNQIRACWNVLYGADRLIKLAGDTKTRTILFEKTVGELIEHWPGR